MALGDICGLCEADVLDIDQKCPGCGADLASTAARRLIGKILLSDYEVLDVLGQGGMAVVYRGRHRVTGQEVALKVLPPELAARRDIKSRFIDEAKALAQLDHPNIVHLYNFDAHEDSFVLAMQLADGPTWERQILEKKIDWRESVALAIQVCSALDYAHGRGIVHRDMKASNVLIRNVDGTAMVMDFGIAKGATDSRLTATGQTMGTVRYMSPEQVRGKDVDRRTDIYSLAITLYESVCGETPFSGETHFEIMSKHLQSIAEPLIARSPQIPQSLSDVVAWGMSKRPDDRPATAAEFGEALKTAASGGHVDVGSQRAVEVVIATEVPERKSRTRWAAWAAALALVAATVTGAAIYLKHDSSSPSASGGSPAKQGLVPVTQSLPRPASAPVLPPDVSFDAEQVFRDDKLRLMMAGGIDAAPYRKAYREGVERWRQYLAREGLTSTPFFRRPMPGALIVVGPGDLLCDRKNFATNAELKECHAVGTYQPRARALLVPEDVKNLPAAVGSFVSLLYCEPPTQACLEAAKGFQVEIFSGE